MKSAGGPVITKEFWKLHWRTKQKALPAVSEIKPGLNQSQQRETANCEMPLEPARGGTITLILYHSQHRDGGHHAEGDGPE